MICTCAFTVVFPYYSYIFWIVNSSDEITLAIINLELIPAYKCSVTQLLYLLQGNGSWTPFKCKNGHFGDYLLGDGIYQVAKGREEIKQLCSVNW